ncbi:MAG: 9-O-acetylesterase [Alistipes sp.]|nr:9-O-acetylesterase [Alistipes sp.]
MGRYIIALLVCLSLGIPVQAGLWMPRVFGDDMVLQRGGEVKIWGRAEPGERVTVLFAGHEVRARADRGGRWEALLPPMEAGGPYEMTVTAGSGRIIFINVLVGEVWVCSGQSNMEWWVAVSADADREVAAADYPEIRSLRVPKRISLAEETDIDGQWVVCSPSTAGDFTAVGYFFAREIHRALGIPVGIIDASWGGTIIESWTRRESYEALPEGVRRSWDPAVVEALSAYPREYPQGGGPDYFDYIARDPGMEERWYLPGAGTRGWDEIAVPALWGDTPLGDTDGVVWYKCTVELPEGWAGREARLSLGRVFDRDDTWVNGTPVGSTAEPSRGRTYTVPEGVLRAGGNEITVRVIKSSGRGGFPDEADRLYIATDEGTVPLPGRWKYRPTVVGDSFHRADPSPHTAYAVLYNGMISPLTDLRIRGVLWYQGESNADNAYDYRVLFPNLISDWRAQWGYTFPFYWVQLANYTAPDARPSDSPWAEVRESQDMALSLHATGQAVAIDIGEAGDIHPRNKQEVGHRLALIALNRTYGFGDVHCEGPRYRAMAVEGDRVRLSFDLHGSRWATANKYGYIEGFAVAGADGRFEWAVAGFDGEDVVVRSDRVPNPVAVRYGWGTNPEAGLFDSEGLPLAPFRTDDWKLSTQR